MKSVLQVVLVLEFDGIDDPNGSAAEQIIQEINEPREMTAMALAYGADNIFVDDVLVKEEF